MRAVSKLSPASITHPALALGLALLALPPRARAEQPAIKFEVEQLVVDGKIQSVDAVDLDGDGKLDLIAAVIKGEKEDAQRSFAIFWNHTGSFAGKPDLVLPLDAGICAYDLAAIDDQPGRALLEVTGGGISARKFTQREAGPAVELVKQQTFCLGVPKHELRRFNTAQPLGPKGATGLLIPGLGLLAVYQREGAQFVKRGELPLEIDTAIDTSGSGDDDAADPGQHGIPRLSVTLGFPSVEVLDVNGDGRADIVLEHHLRIRAFFQGEQGAFASKPDLDHTFHLAGEKAKTGRYEDAALRLLDLDGDGHIDAVIARMSQQGLTSAETKIHLFLGGKDGFRDEPDQVITTDGGGFSGGLLLSDFTGSGHQSLIVPTFSFGIIAFVRMLTSSTIKVNFQLYPFGEGRRFAEKPAAERTLKFHFDPEGKSDQPILNPNGNYQGDGKRGLVFGTEQAELSIYGSKSNALFTDDPIAKVNVLAYGSARAADLDGQGRSDLVIYYPRTQGHEAEIAVVHNRGVR